MLFNSTTFIFFALIFFGLWSILSCRNNPRWILLSVASFIFYGWWDWRFLFLLAGSGLVDYFAALGMRHRPGIKGPLLVASLAANLGGLAVFKYSAFLAANLDSLLSHIGLESALQANLPGMTLILPVGISFYTFQSMSYTIDVYRGQLVPVRNLFHFYAYLAMFPQLVAGPIVRASKMLHQLACKPRTSEGQRWRGTQLIAHGLFKKMVIADNLAPYVDAAFTAPTVAAAPLHWIMVVSMFSFQIYYDFSGYSDIARGLIKWMGYDIDLNFNHPYTATSLHDFWQRWHISLSTWFRDYVYIPLGGSRFGAVVTYRNLWISFLLSGLWHGAAWTFIIWGGLHAVLLSLERSLNWPSKLMKLPGGRALSTLTTLLLVLVCWVFFRAESVGQAVTILGAIVGMAGEGSARPVGKTELLLLSMGILRELYFWLGLNKMQWLSLDIWRKVAVPMVVSLLLAASIFLRGPGNAFIYFQF